MVFVSRPEVLTHQFEKFKTKVNKYLYVVYVFFKKKEESYSSVFLLIRRLKSMCLTRAVMENCVFEFSICAGFQISFK